MIWVNSGLIIAVFIVTMVLGISRKDSNQFPKNLFNSTWEWLGSWICKKNKATMESYKLLYPAEDIDAVITTKQRQMGKMMWIGFLGINVLGLCTTFVSDSEGRIYEGRYIQREVDQGTEDKISVSVEGESFYISDIEIPIGTQVPDDKDMDQIFSESYDYILSEMVGDNPSLMEVRNPLNLVTEIPGISMQVVWHLEDTNYVLENGTLYSESVHSEGEGTNIGLTLAYGGEVKEYDIPLKIYPPEKSLEEKIRTEITEAIEVQNDPSHLEDAFELPREAAGYDLVWTERISDSSGTITLVGIVFLGVWVIYDQDKKKQSLKLRSMQLIEDYPDFIYRIVLLSNAGMNMRSVLKTILEDAKKQNEASHYVYMELDAMFLQMNQGKAEIKAYEDFSKRCGEIEYVKLGTMMIQCVKKGARGMNDLMQSMADEAMHLRRENARRKGEIAGTKLLMPMGVLLIVVFTILIIPAFLSMNL